MEKDFLLIYSDDFKLHSSEPYKHPESPERLEKALEGLTKYKLLGRFNKVEPPKKGCESLP